MAQAIPLSHHGLSVTAALSTLRDAFAAWRQRAEERNQLAQFDERALHDIGLTTADRITLLGKPIWRD